MSVTADSLGAPIAEKSKFGANSILAVVILTIASFMEVLDISIANVSLPNIAGNLSAVQEEAGWIISSYLIANAVIAPISGWLATYFGRKNLYMGCVSIFAVASFFCGISTNLEMLIFFRVLQGLGGGCLMTLEQSFIADTVPPEKHGQAFAIYGLTLVCAPLLGPSLGGWITDTYSWHWIFFINIPIAALSLILAHYFVREPQATIEERKRIKSEGFKVDWFGILTIVVGICALTVVLDTGNRKDWFESEFVVIFSIIAFVALLVGITWELYQKNPAVDVRLFANRNVLGGSVMFFSFAFIGYGSLVFMPLMAQTLLGYDALTAGTLAIPGAIITMILMPVVGRLVRIIEPRLLLMVGLIFSAAALWNLSSISLQISFNQLIIARAIQSFATAFLNVPLMTAAYRGIPQNKIDNASALMSLSGNFGGSLGIAILATVLTRRTQQHSSTLSVHASDYNPNYTQWLGKTAQALQAQGVSIIESLGQAKSMMAAEIQRQASMLAFLDIFHFLMILALLMVPFAFLLKSAKNK